MITLAEGSFTGTPSAGLMAVSFGIFVVSPLFLICWVTWHVNRRNNRRRNGYRR